MLVREFIAQNAAEGRGRVQLSAAALAALARHPWTGNVRELANLIERLSIVCAGRVVEVRDLPPRYQPADGLDLTPIEASGGLAAMTEADDAIIVGSEPLTDTAVIEVLENGARAATEPPEPAAATDAGTLMAAAAVRLPAAGLDLRAYLTSIERRLIEQALESANGTVAHAARLLDLRRTTLVEKLRKLGIGTAESLTED